MPAAFLIAHTAAALLAITPTPASPVSSGWHILPAPTPEPSSGVSLELATCFWDAPPAGMLPVRLAVRNDGPRERDWTLAFDASSGYHRLGTTYSTIHRVSVPGGAERTFELPVPVRAAPSNAGLASSLQVSFQGAGTASDPISLFNNNYYLHSASGQTAHSAWVGLSARLAATHWEATKAVLATRDATMLVGSRFDPGCLPLDWRAYGGFAALAMHDDEWRDLEPGARLAVERWVARGGRLWLASGTAPARRLGFGRIEPLGGREEPTPSVLADAVAGLGGPSADYTGWDLVTDLGAPPLPRGLMLACIISFALVVGPVNLFGFCRGPHRHRVFWTTPLISAAAVAGLGSVILLQDGTGGIGHRLTLVGLLPDRHEEVVLQEQIARTGLLVGSHFAVAEPVLLEMLDTAASVGWRPAELGREGEAFAGSWFVSRALQAHWIESVRPSRARFEIEEGAAAPPRLTSTVPDTLDDVFFVDGQARVWHATNVGPGRAVEMTAADGAALESWLEKITAHHGPRLQERVIDDAATVWAGGTRSRAPIATLGSIRWNDHGTLYVQRMGS